LYFIRISALVDIDFVLIFHISLSTSQLLFIQLKKIASQMLNGFFIEKGKERLMKRD